MTNFAESTDCFACVPFNSLFALLYTISQLYCLSYVASFVT